MKKKFYLSLWIIVSGFLFSNLWAYEAQKENGYDKIYLNASNLIIHDDCMFMLDPFGQLRSVTIVSVDNQGLFVLSPQFWYCERCQRDHWGACPMDY